MAGDPVGVFWFSGEVHREESNLVADCLLMLVLLVTANGIWRHAAPDIC